MDHVLSWRGELNSRHVSAENGVKRTRQMKNTNERATGDMLEALTV